MVIFSGYTGYRFSPGNLWLQYKQVDPGQSTPAGRDQASE